ncbi:MAG: exonuclease domain-containing protein [Fuerstiella sp.]
MSADSNRASGRQSCQFRQASTRQYAVIDVETTGFSNKDRVLEIAIVVLDEQFNVVNEFDSLVDPMRDVGRADIHGITPSMLANAPAFEDVASTVASIVHGRVIVAHNLPFDSRMVRNEYARLGAEFNAGAGICTLQHTRMKLSLACETFGVSLDQHHRALADARATAQLLKCIADESLAAGPASVDGLAAAFNPRTLRREASLPADTDGLRRRVLAIRYPDAEGSLLSYLNLLDYALDDLVITTNERNQLTALARELQLDHATIQQAHRQYLQSMIQAAERDGVITPEEHSMLTTVAEILCVNDVRIPECTQLASEPTVLQPGMRVCFTGTAVDVDNCTISRRLLESWARQAGLVPVPGVTRSNCDLLVAADPCSTSGKARQARRFGIPVISTLAFLKQLQCE